MGRENAFTLSGEPRREKLITILFKLDFLTSVCYDVAIDTLRKGGHFEKVDVIEQNKNFVQSSGGENHFSPFARRLCPDDRGITL